MPNGAFESRAGRWLTRYPIACAGIEIAYIALQAARVQASHYKFSSTLYSTIYSVMGLGAVSPMLVCAWMASRIGRRFGTRDVYAFAVVVGLWIAAILSIVFGWYLGAQRGHWVGGAPTDAGGWWLVKWARDGGDLCVSYFSACTRCRLSRSWAGLPVDICPAVWLSSSC